MSSNLTINRSCIYCKRIFGAKTIKTRYCSHICNQKDYKQNKKLDKIRNSEIQIKPKAASFDPNVNVNSIDFLTVKQAAILLSMSSKTIHRLIARNEINAINFSVRKTLIRRKDIESYFDNSLVKTNPINYYIDNEINLDNSYTIKEAIEKFKVSRGTIIQIIERFNIPSKKLGNFTLVKKADLNIFFNK